MPVTFLDRLPLPSLRVYTASSFALLSVSVYYAISVTNDADWKANITAPSEPLNKISSLSPQKNDTASIFSGKLFNNQLIDVFTFMVQEPFCIWTLINMSYCLLVLLGTLIQHLVFGKLRVSEQQHAKDKFWNFIFYKFIFVFGVINVQYMDEMLLWCSWFSVLGFLILLSQICKDRFEYLSFSPMTPRWSHIRLLTLLSAIFITSVSMLAMVGMYASFNTFAFMAAECILLILRTSHVILKYIMHLYSPVSTSSWDKRAPTAYYIELIFDTAALSIELSHHIHMLLWSNMFLSMASFVILMQLRHLSHELQARLRKHRHYLWLLNHMDRNYPMATQEEVSENSDNCAICWEKMDSARKLPCSHLFHNSCLVSWLQQDPSCPTCRRSLPRSPTAGAGQATGGVQQPTVAHPQNHFFHFDGSRYVSWLPSFSVEVTRVRLENHTISQHDVMARQIQQMFPHFPLSVIMQDLQTTRSIEHTVENILENRLSIPARFAAEFDGSDEGNTNQSDNNSEESGETRQDLTLPTLAIVSGNSNAADDWNAEANIFNEWENIQPIPSGFSTISDEREQSLQRRKEILIAHARKKYITKHGLPAENRVELDIRSNDSYNRENDPSLNTS